MSNTKEKKPATEKAKSTRKPKAATKKPAVKKAAGKTKPRRTGQQIAADLKKPPVIMSKAEYEADAAGAESNTPTTPPLPKQKKLSLVNAAVAVLNSVVQKDGTPTPLSSKEMVGCAMSAGLWIPGKGKTPVNTLAAAISTEIKKKGSASRFARADQPGRFILKD